MLLEIGKNAKTASRVLAVADTNAKNAFLADFAAMLIERCDEVLAANAEDMRIARDGGMRQSLLDRLELTCDRISSIADGVRQVAQLNDPLGSGEITKRPNGLIIEKRAVPLGVVGFIYEARPNVTADAAALCIKSGNAVLLRGSKDALNSNKKITELIRRCLQNNGLPEDCCQLVEDCSREVVTEMMGLRGYIDVLIPRGGAGLIRSVVENAKVPVIETGSGICHIYVDETADLALAAEITFNAKCSRPSVCNAIETLLVSDKIAERFLPLVKQKLDTKNTEIRGDLATCAILPTATPATDEDYNTEFGDYILAVKIVKSLDEAIAHISATGTGHSEAIVTTDYANSQRFLNEVDAAAVYVNASTRFTDGGEFGLGAEIGISTQKLHVRGPMGLQHLTSWKYAVFGNGQVR